MKSKDRKREGQKGASPNASRSRAVLGERPAVLDFVLNRISLHNESCGGGVGVRKQGGGYTLFVEATNTPLARLRPKAGTDEYEIFHWSPFRQRWQHVGPVGGIVLPLDDALDFIADDPLDCFWY